MGVEGFDWFYRRVRATPLNQDPLSIAARPHGTSQRGWLRKRRDNKPNAKRKNRAPLTDAKLITNRLTRIERGTSPDRVTGSTLQWAYSTMDSAGVIFRECAFESHYAHKLGRIEGHPSLRRKVIG